MYSVDHSAFGAEDMEVIIIIITNSTGKIPQFPQIVVKAQGWRFAWGGGG